MSEKSYPYTLTTKRKTCRYNYSETYARVDSWNQLPSNEIVMEAAVYSMGPVAVSVNAKYFQNYKSGILQKDEKECPGSDEDLDHAVTIVGYGTEDSVPYWIVKN